MIYQIKDVDVTLGSKNILKKINCDISEHSFMVLIGKNGAGKTTLIKAMVGLLKPSGGGVRYKDKLLPSWGDDIFKEVGVVLQNPDHQIFSLTVQEEIEFVLKNFKQDVTKAPKILESFDFLKFKDRIPFYLSEGEKKKLCIISVLAHEPEVLILDEPFSTLDWYERNKMFQFLKKIKRKKTIIVATHDLRIAKLFDRIILLDKGQLIGDGTFSTVKEKVKEIGLIDDAF